PIDAGFEADHFQRSQALVMIHRNNNVVVTAEGIVEESVRGDRTFDIQASSADAFDGGSDGGNFFGSHFATFASVRIQTANRYAGAGQAEVFAGLRGELDGLLDLGTRNAIRHGAKRQMSGDESDAQPAVTVIGTEEHHCGSISSG